jgi:hypothetical protein
MTRKAQTRPRWQHRGIASMGDAHGEIHIWSAYVDGRRITKRTHSNGRVEYVVGNTRYRRLRDAIDAPHQVTITA